MNKQVTERILKKDLIKLFTSVPHDFIDDFFVTLWQVNFVTLY